MQSISVRGLAVVLAAAAWAATLGGCESGPSMGRYTIEVSLDSALASRPGGPPQITVDLVGLNDTQVPAWTAKSMTAYWTPNDAMRLEAKDYRSEMTFGPGNAETKKLARDAGVWDTWKSRGAMHLYVLAALPGARGDRPGAEDGRRVILPLDKRRWKKDTIRIVVQNSQLDCVTPPEPEPR